MARRPPVPRPTNRNTAPRAEQADRISPAGTAFEPTIQRMERGVVVGSDAARDAYRVRTNAGSVITLGRMRQSVGDHERIPNGTWVCVSWALGTPYIVGILPNETRDVGGDNALSITDTDGHGGEDPVLSQNLRLNGRAPGEPRDVMQGDYVRTSPDGAAIGALHGKVAMVKGSPLAQLRCHGETNQVDLIAALFRMVTWMGESRYVNDGGHLSYQWRGGRHQVTESGPDEERFTLHLDVGHTGDVAKFRVTTPQQETLFEAHVDGEGHLRVFARNGVNLFTGGAGGIHRVDGDHGTEVAGDHSERVHGSATRDHEANHRQTVGQTDTRIVGRDRIEVVGRDASTEVGGDATTSVNGDVNTTSVTGNVALGATAGAVDVHAARDVTLSTPAGDVVVEPTAGEFHVRTDNPDKVLFGIAPTSHAVKYEELVAFLIDLIGDYNAFKAAVAAAVYPVAGASAGPAPTLAAVSVAFNKTMELFRSRLVRLG